MVYFYLIFWVLILSFVGVVSCNMVVWWSIFIFMTIIFIMIVKSVTDGGVINYFIIQESLGLFFLIFIYQVLQFVVVLMKIGVSPFHFWIFSVTNGLWGWSLVWFLTMQKVPFFFILMSLFIVKGIFLLLLGILLCYYQMFFLKDYSDLLILSATESFNWVLLVAFMSFFNVLFLFMFYLILMVFIMPGSSHKDFNFVSWETALVFMNVPLGVSFFIKIFSLSEVLMLNYFMVLVILFFMFLSILSLSFWLVNLSTEEVSSEVYDNWFFIYPLMFLALI